MYKFTGECVHCAGWHGGVCPNIKAIEYYPDGSVRKVEYHDHSQPLPATTPQCQEEEFDWAWVVSPDNVIVEDNTSQEF